MRNVYNHMYMFSATEQQMWCFYICVLILTWNDCLRELNAALPETDLLIVINEQTLNNAARASLRTLFITLFVICYLKHYLVIKRIIIHKYYRIKPVISVPVLQHNFKIIF